MSLHASDFYATASALPPKFVSHRAPANGLITPGPLSQQHPDYLKRKLLLDKFAKISESYYAFFSFSLTPEVFMEVSEDPDLVKSAYAFFNDCVLVVNNNNAHSSHTRWFSTHTLYEPTSRLVYVVRHLSDFVYLSKISFHPDDRRVFVLSLEFPEEKHFLYEYFLRTFNVDNY